MDTMMRSDSFELAAALFPGEEWIPYEEGIFVAKSRLAGGRREQDKLRQEIFDVHILTGRGSVAYFLPEREKDGEVHCSHADTVIDGEVVELKTVSGNRATLGKSFRRGYKQGRSLLRTHGVEADHSVFLRLYTPFSVESVRAKLAGELKNTTGHGRSICSFEASGELFFWDYDELRAIVGAMDNGAPHGE
ncbi:MAG: hypothetical protein LBD09_01320 [Treponema sp.]|nr:hypothetical protein [Treponema sp.]